MGSYNQSQFNLGSFNLGTSGNAIWLDLEGYEQITYSGGVSVDLFYTPIGFEHVRSEAHLIRSNMRSASGVEVIGYNTDLIGRIWLDIAGSEVIENSADFAVSRTIAISEFGNETITTETTASSEVYISGEGEEIVDSENYMRREIYLDIDGSELVSSTSSVEAVNETVCLLNVTLKPGQHLVIDARNYNVLLDNQNAIEIQSGEWLDALNRNTSMITISAARGSSGLSASIMYTERYL